MTNYVTLFSTSYIMSCTIFPTCRYRLSLAIGGARVHKKTHQLHGKGNRSAGKTSRKTL